MGRSLWNSSIRNLLTITYSSGPHHANLNQHAHSNCDNRGPSLHFGSSAIRARQLTEKIYIDRNYVATQIENLLAIADAQTLEYLKLVIKTEPDEVFVNLELAPKFESAEDFIRRLDAAIKNKKQTAETIIAE